MATKSVKKPTGLSTSVLGVDGKAVGRVTLPEKLFGAKVNSALLTQSIRVYLANQRKGTASTKTRGEVEGSTRKIYRQKGTGRARHGGIRAPIFVGGGIVFGPRPRDYHLKMGKVMKQKALYSALSQKYNDGGIVVIDGLETLEPKTKHMASAFAAIKATNNVLFALPKEMGKLTRAVRNLPYVDIVSAVDLFAYTVLTHKTLVFTKPAIEELKKKGK